MLFHRKETFVTRILPTKFKEVKQPEVPQKILKQKLHFKAKQQKRLAMKLQPKPLTYSERMFRYTIYQNNKQNKGSKLGVVVPIFMSSMYANKT